MNKIIVNVGLNVGKFEPKYQLDNTLSCLSSMFTINNVKVVIGEYEGQKERTLVAEVETGNNLGLFTYLLMMLAENLEQECIAFTYNGDGNVAHSPQMKGKEIVFNKDFFTDFS